MVSNNGTELLYSLIIILTTSLATDLTTNVNNQKAALPILHVCNETRSIKKGNTLNESLTPMHAAEPMMSTTTAQGWTFTRILLAIGAAGPVVFLGLATLAALFTPGYNMLAHPVSELALGPSGWLQTLNFYLFGLAIIVFAVGLFRSLPRPSWVGTGLLIITGACMVASGIFPGDLKGAPETDTGAIHNLLFLVLILALIISYFFSAFSFRKLAGWRGYMWATVLVPFVVFGLVFVFIGFASDIGDPLYAIGGLIQRLLLAVAFGWMTLTAWRLLSAKLKV